MSCFLLPLSPSPRLLKMFLRWESDQRVSASDAMKHRYFEEPDEALSRAARTKSFS